MKRNMIKIFSILLVGFMIISNSNMAYAMGTTGNPGQDALHEGEQQLMQEAHEAQQSAGGSSLNPSVSLITPDTTGTTGQNTSKIVNIVVGTIQIIGVAAAIIMLVFLAIKYVSAAPSEKADIKKGAVIYIVGAVFLFGASVILGFVSDFITEIGS